MEIYFTKIKWAGTDCILVTDNQHNKNPLLILNETDIERLIKEWKRKLEDEDE